MRSCPWLSWQRLKITICFDCDQRKSSREKFPSSSSPIQSLSNSTVQDQKYRDLTMPVPNYLLSESAAGYSLYQVTQSEEIGSRTQEFLKLLNDPQAFRRL